MICWRIKVYLLKIMLHFVHLLSHCVKNFPSWRLSIPYKTLLLPWTYNRVSISSQNDVDIINRIILWLPLGRCLLVSCTPLFPLLIWYISSLYLWLINVTIVFLLDVFFNVKLNGWQGKSRYAFVVGTSLLIFRLAWLIFA